jgi:hypothetical protein
VDQRDAPHSPSANSTLPPQRESRPIRGGESFTTDEAYSNFSSPLFRTFRARSFALPAIGCAALLPCLTELPPATFCRPLCRRFCRPSCYQRVFGSILHVVSSPLHGLAIRDILRQTLLKPIMPDPRLGSQLILPRQTGSWWRYMQNTRITVSKYAAVKMLYLMTSWSTCPNKSSS